MSFCPAQLLLTAAFAYSSGGQDHKPGFQHFTVEDGLSQGSVTSILQDHRGFMWIGTHDGLNRFDGIEFRVYRHHPGDSTSLGNNWITELYEDKANILWVGTYNGLNRFDPATETFVHYTLPISDPAEVWHNTVVSIQETHVDGTSKLWVGMPRLHVLDSGGRAMRPVVHQAEREVNAQPHTPSTTRKDDTFLWTVEGGRVLRFDPRNESVDRSLALGLQLGTVLPSRKNRENELWGGGFDGFYRIDVGARTAVKLLPQHLTSFIEDRSGQLWLGTDNGLLRLSFDGLTQTVTEFHHQPAVATSLSNDAITAIFEDAAGSLWIGTFNGLNRLDEFTPTFSIYRHLPDNSNSLGSDFVLPIMEDKNGNVWFGTFDSGISILENDGKHGDGFTQLRNTQTKSNVLHENTIRSFLQDRGGMIWVGTGSGLAMYDPATRSSTSFGEISADDTISFWVEALCETRDGTLWAGASGIGLVRIDRSTARSRFSVYPLRQQGDRVASEEVHCIVEDGRGVLWVGTEVGLVRFDPGTETATRFLHDASDTSTLSSDVIWSILEDTSDSATLWVGSSQGLNLFNVKTGMSRRYLEQEGFPNAYVYGILRDDWGRLWLSTNHGLTCFDDRQPTGRKFKNYDASDGVQGNEFNRHSYCRLRSGEFLFGGTHGVTRFHPLQMHNNPHPPPVVLTSFAKAGKHVQFDRDINDVSIIELDYDDNVFAFEFAALNYTNPSRNQYAYMLEGLDKEWVHAGERRYANYTHLDPGEYVFRVKASNNDGVWNEQGAAVRMIIQPPFWGTWWFRMLLVAGVMISLFVFYQWRVHGLEKEKRMQQEFSLRLMESQETERKRIAGELHDSLGQDLLVVRNRALLGLKDESLSVHVRDQLDQISSVATQAINNVREISHDLRPYQLDRLGLTKAITSLASMVADSSSIRFLMDVDPIDDEVSKDQAIHVYRIVQEAINNILKHSGASEARVEVRVTGGDVRITVYDNGRGMRPESSGDAHGRQGFGLIGITERAKVLNGTVAIASVPDKGTTLTVVIPRAKKSP